MSELNKDYLVVCFLGGGASWYRDCDLDNAVKKCKRYAKQDWKHVFDFDALKKSGRPLTMCVYDVTSEDDCAISDHYVRSVKTGSNIEPDHFLQVSV